eukprot:TRINITY_DN1846_c1_g1_i2.p1 TRINITY_DN1846_c1_g1~~TRINITY_DN1846_c1_g1_i2.p1  ORF type:complete len:564 (-),score=155.87 TRINITY_DN1846_c1_g1_i2:765-2243(-)
MKKVAAAAAVAELDTTAARRRQAEHAARNRRERRAAERAEEEVLRRAELFRLSDGLMAHPTYFPWGQDNTRRRPPLFRSSEGRSSNWMGNFRAFSLAYADRSDLEESDKILMPSSALNALTEMNLNFPYIFQMTNPANGMHVSCSVLEFVAEESKVNLPYWLMEFLGIDEGGNVRLETVVLKKGTFVKLQPLAKQFYEINDPKAFLEAILSKFATLTKGTTVRVHDMPLRVVELQPDDSVAIIDVEIQVDFAPMPGLEEAEAETGTTSDGGRTTPPAAGKSLMPTPPATPPPAGRTTPTPPPAGRTTPTPPSSGRTTPTPSPACSDPSFVAFSGTGNRQSGVDDSHESKYCNTCARKIPVEHYELHRVRCERFNTFCSLCGTTMLKTELEAHTQENHGLVTCACGEKMDKFFLAEHQLAACAVRPVDCPYCTAKVPRRDFAAHKQYCGSRTQPCDKCGHNVPIKGAVVQSDARLKFYGQSAVVASKRNLSHQ